jgi:hypothetical protein
MVALLALISISNAWLTTDGTKLRVRDHSLTVDKDLTVAGALSVTNKITATGGVSQFISSRLLTRFLLLLRRFFFLIGRISLARLPRFIPFTIVTVFQLINQISVTTPAKLTVGSISDAEATLKSLQTQIDSLKSAIAPLGFYAYKSMFFS